MSLRVQEFHDCPSIRPSMVVGTESVVEIKGVWPFRRKVTREETIYDKRNAEWTCPICKSVWQYSGSLINVSGWWRALKRTSTWKNA